MQGHRKYSNGLSDASNSGSFMDDTDREVSNLTDRAFRSLCIGEEAIYNDSEFSSSPTERHKAFEEETQQKTISHEALSYSIQQCGEAGVQSEMASTFQHSYVDVTHQEQAFREGSLSYMSNGSKEVTWQKSRSTSRVSSLIKAFSSGECYHDSGTCDVILARDRYRDFGSESWDRSAMLSIQRELSEFSSGYHQNFKSGPFQSYRNHFYTSDVGATVAQMDTTVLMKSSKSKFKALNSTNCFFHSEFSPFQLWEEYNRFSFQSTNVSGFMSPREFPRWYDSPMYKELKDNHRIPNSPCESRRFEQKQIQDVVASQCSRSTVVQKTSAIEKRCESEMTSNYPPWKKNNNLVRNKLPGNRPSTVSPTNERTCRPDSNLFRNNKVTHEIVVKSNLPSNVTPFNITQLLTPVIHTRQETETSEILRFAQTPSVSDYSSQGETDPKLQTDVKHMHDSYKFKASSLLFNLKDNRKRVKSTYSPTRFKGLEITDRNKQTSKLEGRESRFSDILVSQETAQENLIGKDARASCNLIGEPSEAPITTKDYTDGFGSYDILTLTSPQIQDRVANYKLFRESSEGHSSSTDPLANTELSTRYLSAQDKSSLTSESHLKDLNGTFIPARPEIANVLPRAYPPTHSLPAQTSERYGQSNNASQNDLKQRKDFGRKAFIEYSQNEAVKEKCPWDQIGSVKETDSRSESQPFRGEIAALIEMDKQRKSTAEHYFANDSYSVRKETYMQKVNEDIKLGRLAKQEEKENVESTAGASNITILTPSNKEPVEEPIIYGICVSSKTEAASNDEPMIYTICVSSKCHIDEQQNPVKQEEESSVETDRFVKDESFCIKNTRVENEHDDVHRQTEVSSNIEEKEDKIGKCEPPATTDKSGITGRISTSYEDLLAKYGLPVRVCGHLTSKHMQDERKQKEKEETETRLPHKPINHGMNRPLPSKEKSSDTTQTHPEDSRQVSDQQASITSQPLKGTESEIKQVKVQHYDTISVTHSNNMAEKQQSTGNNTPELGHSTRDATIILKDTENVEQDQDTHIEPSRQNRGNDIELKEKKVEEQVRNTDKVQSLKMTGNIDVVSNSRESPMKTENVSLTAKQPTTTDESTRPTKTEVLKAPISSMAKDTVITKLIESTIPERMIPQSKKKSQKVEGKEKLFNDADTFTSQKNKIHGTEVFNLKVEKTVDEAKQKDPVMAMKQESVSEKHAQTLQKNGKEDEKGGEKRSQEKLQVEFNTRNEMVLKDSAATHVNNYRDKVSIIGEDVCTVVKQDQACFVVPKIHLEDIKVSTAEVSSNKEFMAGHKNQHEVIKKENLKGKKGAVVAELVGEKDFTEQKNLPVKSLTVQNEPKTVDNMKGHIEMASKNTYDVGKEITPLKKDSPIKLEKTEINPRRGAVETQDIKVYDNKQPRLNSDKRKKEDPVLNLSGQNDGDLKVNENRSSLRGKKERNVDATETKQGEQSNTNQYQPETKGSARYEQEHAQLSQQNTRKECIVSKPEATQRNMKGTRPEISAIADYARLKVISAEDDTKELDIFPKTDSYDQPVLRIHKDLYGNVSDIGGETKRDVISMEKCQNLKQKTSQLKKQTDKETLSQNQNHLVPSTVQLKPVSPLASGSQNEPASLGTQPKALTNQKESNTKPTLMEHPNRRERNNIYQSKNPQGVPLQANRTISRSRQMTHDKTTEKGNLSHCGRQESLANLSVSGTVKAADNQINMASPPGEEMEELQYYTVNALDTEIKPKEAPEPPPPSLKVSQNTDPAEKSEEEKKEDSFLQSLIDYNKVHATGTQSNSSSPAMGKPVMFRVKDNTIRTSSVTKTVKPRFHRSFSEDFRIGSPKEHLSECGSEKEDEIHPIESANPPVNHDPAIAALRLHKLKETLHNNLPSAENATKQSKSLQRRSQHFEEEETRSVISTMSEDMENCTASITDVANISVAFMPKHERYRDTYQRPASACYERPESSCYERPESACSDMRPLGKPPAVPPKSEKALRRAQRLTTRRMKKAETPKMAPENQDQLESKSIRNISGVPSSPSDTLSTHLEVQASPPLSQYDIQPNHTLPAHSIVTQPFPVTQRKLLQDPNSGQYFMVDVPLLVKTKTFYDPETGKYVQLNVRQRSQGALTQPGSLEMLNTPYMLYRGLLPMAASSLTPLRSSSEMSTSADNQDTLERGSEPWSQNGHLQNSNRDSQQYPDILYRSHEQNHNPSLYAENSINDNERHTDIKTMSELEDFAMESS
ncbi:hypothetical protein cypCar_00039202 [Cyprinus carpio]|nr:hypothetical protein cypCar_00039202 [Cyprinus carpio]